MLTQLNDGCAWNDVHRRTTFAAAGPMEVAPGGCVELEMRSADSGDCCGSYGGIRFRRPGVYCVMITVDIQQCADVHTVMRLELDGRILTPPEIHVDTQGCECAHSHTGCGMFFANAGSVLRLTTLHELSVPCTSGHPVFTVTLMRIGAVC